MKKIVFLLAALMAVFSGIAAVSAYEGHLVDIKAHVENAIGVEKYQWDLGTSFPQEVRESDLVFGLSESFRAQTRVSSVGYKLCWELKPKPVEPAICKPYMDKYYQPLNPFMDMSLVVGTVDASKVKIVPAEGAAVCWGVGDLWFSPKTGLGKLCEVVHVKFSVPVFEGYYNAVTDVQPANWTFGMIKTADYCTKAEKLGCNDVPVTVPHADLGINMKIQVTGFATHE